MSLPTLGTFPFGQPLRQVEQTDRSPKRVFVLGVYSSAVHACWLDPKGKVLVRALAVASEPYIFWRGDGVSEVLGRITLPPEAGSLVPAEPQLNGPSGKALDSDILTPLKLTRAEAWLCDLVPHACLNPRQQAALARVYDPRVKQLGLPAVDLPKVPKDLATQQRRQKILEELVESKASTIILLGDEPIKHWLRHYDSRWTRLSAVGDYGRVCITTVEGKAYELLTLAHPRQIAGLGPHSPKWREAHKRWKASLPS